MNEVQLFVFIATAIVCFFLGRTLGFREAIERIGDIMGQVIRIKQAGIDIAEEDEEDD